MEKDKIQKFNLIKEETLTVLGLINILKEYPLDMKCITTWEGTIGSLTEENIYNTFDNKYLILDADNNLYREEFENGFTF